MTTQVIFKIDKKLKDQAMKKAQGEGISFSSILKLATQAYIMGTLEVELISRPRLNEKTFRELEKISKDIKEGRNLVGPFKNVSEMKKYLKS
jgi:antitoxin component of RelBE/YafQ-DinJ toxin-antitoxin module